MPLGSILLCLSCIHSQNRGKFLKSFPRFKARVTKWEKLSENSINFRRFCSSFSHVLNVSQGSAKKVHRVSISPLIAFQVRLWKFSPFCLKTFSLSNSICIAEAKKALQEQLYRLMVYFYGNLAGYFLEYWGKMVNLRVFLWGEFVMWIQR